MCGIVGQFSFSTLPEDTEHIIAALTRLMHRRGPDDEGYWRDDRHCILGFRRLSILDLSSAGHQPMLTPDGRYALVMNGEVYNFKELRTELEQRGVRFRSNGDTEVVLYALAEWGINALQRFNGMFALGFYDNQDKRLLLARDFAGIKPLYVFQSHQGVIFASQYNQITAHPWASQLKYSQDGLAQFLRFGYIPAPYAAHEDVSMLEPGTWFEVGTGGNARQGRFFDFPINPDPDLSGADAYEAVDVAVTQAVKRQMVSDVPIGAFLSGGIDSPLVTAKMQAVSNQPVTAFTIGMNGSDLDETVDALQYATELQVEHILQNVTENDALILLDDVVNACSEPFADYSIFPTLLVSRLASQRAKVMLSGDGGDELFWGYSGRFKSVLLHAYPFKYPKWMRSVYWHTQKYLTNARNLWSIQNYATIGEWYQDRHSHLSEGWARSIFQGLPPMPRASCLFAYDGHRQDPTANWLRWNEFTGHLSMVLLKVDRGSMYNSLEVRVPLLDKDVIQTACRVDWRSCLNLQTGEGKIPLRKSLSQHAHHQSVEKKGFSVPMDKWMRGPLRNWFEEKVIGQKGLFGLELDQKALRGFFNAHIHGQADYSWGMWILLSAALWQEKNEETAESLRWILPQN